MKIFFTIFFATVLFVVNSFAIDSDGIEAKVDVLLERKELTKLANEFAEKRDNSTETLLMKLSVFSRAGHRLRVSSTLQEIGEIYAQSNQKSTIYSSVKNHIDINDLAQLQIFYNKIAVNGDVYSRDVLYNFIKLWQKETNDQEIENWLKARADKSDKWWRQWFLFKKSLGTESEVYEDFVQKLRNDPTNFELLEKYFRNVPKEYKDRHWLLDVVPNDSAYESYDIASYFPKQTAIKLYEKSLKLPFTVRDEKLAIEREFRMASILVLPKNLEKYIRYQTKLRLIELYKKNNQADLAQPLVEELNKQDNSGYVAKLAGGVQLATGQRKVEKQILASEAENQNSAEYWLKRAAYYKGRNEKKIVWQTYLTGLSKFKYDPKDRKKFYSRLEILKELAEFGEKFDELATQRILVKEIEKAKSANDGLYLLELAYISENEFDDVYSMNFINTDLFAKALSTVKNWNRWEHPIEWALTDDRWNENKRNEVIDKLSSIALGDLKNRGYYLAKALQDSYPEKAILLFEELVKIAPKEINEEFNFDRDDIEEYLFKAYLKSGNWKKAETLFNKNNYRKSYLSRIAVSAANRGDINDAFRLWKMQANYDRRILGGLSALAKTNAKPLLQEFYRTMQKEDSLTQIPETALELLRDV